MTQLHENFCRRLTENPSRIYVIAEAGLDHGLSQEKALALVRAAKWSGADAVKFQTLGADGLASRQPEFLGHTKQHPHKSFEKADLPFDIFRTLCKETKRIGIEFVSTPFDKESVDFFDELGVAAFNIACSNITRRPLIEHVSSKGKPMLLSTRNSRDEEVRDAMDWMHGSPDCPVVLLHCVSSSAKPEELDLRMLQYLRNRFNASVGFSDPSAGTLGSIIATSLGAQVIERRFILETRYETADMSLSMDAKQLKLHIEELRSIGRILGERGTSALEGKAENKLSSREAGQQRRAAKA